MEDDALSRRLVRAVHRLPRHETPTLPEANRRRLEAYRRMREIIDRTR